MIDISVMEERGIQQAIESLQAGQVTVTESICREILRREARNFEAHYYLGAALQAMGRLHEAADSYRAALEIRPDLPEALSNLGLAMHKLKCREESLEYLQKAVALRPDLPEAQNNLGNALHDAGQLAAAEACFRRAIETRPDFAEGHSNLGTVLQRLGRATEAIESFRAAARLRPNSPEIFNNLGNVLQKVGRLDEAIACYQHTLTLRPAYVAAHGNLGNALKKAGRLDEALLCYDRALALDENCAGALSGRLYTIHFHDGYDARAIFQAHQRWNDQHARPLGAKIEPHANDRTPGRKLRIGYVSPNFRDHVIGRFMLPLLANLDRARFEIVCYADVARPDAITEQIRGWCAQWCCTVGLSDEQLAGQIRRDRIDILVDLNLHMGHSRLLAFARKPAPVQVTWLAYCSTSGLSAMDYRLTDPYLDPFDGAQGGADESCDGVAWAARPCLASENTGEPPVPRYSERSVRLPHSYWCYPAPPGAPPVGPLPALTTCRVTFGCLNNFCKVTPPCVQTWCRILQAVPSSRLLIHAFEGTHRRLLVERMARDGIDPVRIEFAGFTSTDKYFQRYHEIDLALDPFPYAGGTTTCDALWMGVPVVSLAGNTAVSRGGSSILSNVGLGELVARTREEYVRIAADWASDLPRLSDLRRSLRQRIETSPLMDAPRFAREMENAYEEMWRRWIESPA